MADRRSLPGQKLPLLCRVTGHDWHQPRGVFTPTICRRCNANHWYLSTAYVSPTPGPCAACGHDPACGFASVNDDWFCHDDDHSCYSLVEVES